MPITLLKLTNWAEKQAMYGAISANALTRSITGRGNPLLTKVIDEMRESSGKEATQYKGTTSQIKGVAGMKAIPHQPGVGEANMGSYTHIAQAVKDSMAGASGGAKGVKARIDANAGHRVERDLNNLPGAAKGIGGTAGVGKAKGEEHVIKVVGNCAECNKKWRNKWLLKLWMVK